MRSHAESQGKTPFDWYKFLQKAFEDNITEGEFLTAVKLASSYTTCACGNQCQTIPRAQNGSPMDNHLESLGIDFYTFILNKMYNRALSTLNEIEKRSAFLIKEQSGKQKKLF